MQHPCMLIVDDDPDICELIREVGAALDFQATVVTDALEFKQVYTASYDVIVLDLMLPGADGVELLRFLAAQTCRAAILIVSGFEKRILQTTQELAGELGLNVVGHLCKPFRIAELEAVL